MGLGPMPRNCLIGQAAVFLVLLSALVLGTAAGGAGAVSDPAFDDFERGTLGSNWVVYNGDVGIINKSDLGVLSRSSRLLGLGILAWNATVFRADQFSQARISVDADRNVVIQVFVRRRQSDNQRYGFHWRLHDGGGRWEIKRDGAPNAPVLASVPGPSPAPGDTIRVEVAGSTITGFRNGVRVLTTTDSMLTEPGQPGIVLNVYWVTRFPVPAVESWTGGSL